MCQSQLASTEQESKKIIAGLPQSLCHKLGVGSIYAGRVKQNMVLFFIHLSLVSPLTL